MSVTFTRVHVYISFANPYLVCASCAERVTAWHSTEACGCEAPCWNVPCGHTALTASVCPSWSPVDGCACPTGAHPAPTNQASEEPRRG